MRNTDKKRDKRQTLKQADNLASRGQRNITEWRERCIRAKRESEAEKERIIHRDNPVFVPTCLIAGFSSMCT